MKPLFIYHSMYLINEMTDMYMKCQVKLHADMHSYYSDGTHSCSLNENLTIVFNVFFVF